MKDINEITEIIEIVDDNELMNESINELIDESVNERYSNWYELQKVNRQKRNKKYYGKLKRLRTNSKLLSSNYQVMKNGKKREYYRVNRAKILKKRQMCREEARQYSSQYYQTHREEALRYSSQYYQTHREEIRERNAYSVDSYFNDIKKGPTCVCISCGRLFFDRSMTSLKYSQMLGKCTLEFLSNACPLIDNYCDKRVDNDVIGLACSNCKLYLMKSEIPPLSLAHKELPFPEIPSELLALNTLEERFLAPRIGFIQISIWN